MAIYTPPMPCGAMLRPASSKAHRPHSACVGGYKHYTLFTGGDLYALKGFGDQCTDLIYLSTPIQVRLQLCCPHRLKGAGGGGGQ